MKLLCWDTSSKAGAVVAMEWNETHPSDADWGGVRLVSEFALNVDATHSERLLWAIHQVLVSARWNLEDVDAFAVGAGPGSFTGLRIGITTARTLAHSLGKPLISLSSLAALARPVARYFSSGAEKVLVIAATDACKGELFSLWGEASEVQKCAVRGEFAQSALWSGGVREEVLTPDQFLRDLLPSLENSDSSLTWVAVGEGVQRYPHFWSQLPQAQRRVFPLLFSNQVDARELGVMACECLRIQKNWDPLKVFPRYLRASDAELKLKAGLLAPSKTS